MSNKSDNLGKLANPVFLLSIGLLLLNDFYLKQAFGNVITGKLSDFAGLLAFPFFFSCLMPGYKKTVHVLTLLLFILWKSSFSQPFIDLVNSMGIPIGRVVDYTDYIALISIFISYYLFNRKFDIVALKPVYLWSIIAVSSFSFMATQIPRRTAIEFTSVDKEYKFPISKENFLTQFNKLQEKEIKKLTSKYSYLGEFNEEAGVFYLNNRDTLAYLINIDTHKDSDTITVNNYLADFQIYAVNSDTTILKLINVATSISAIKSKEIPDDDLVFLTDSSHFKSKNIRYYYGRPVGVFVINPDNIKIKEKAIKEFEKRIIKKIKSK